jgi:hypothetical protein
VIANNVRRLLRRVATVLIAVSGAAVLNGVLSGFAGNVAFNVGRVAIAFAGGWFIVSFAHKGLWMAAVVGPVVMLVDHVILKGGFFVLAHYFWPSAVQGEGLLAAGGVLISFAMFLPLAALCSWAGGLVALRKDQKVEAQP